MINSALSLQPDLPEVHLAYALHLYGAYRDYGASRRSNKFYSVREILAARST